jgi:hypothetical protein
MDSEASPAELHWRRIQSTVDQFDFGTRILQFVEEVYGAEAILSAWQEFRDRDFEEDEGTAYEFGSKCFLSKLFISWLAFRWKMEEDPEEAGDSDLIGLVPTEAFLDRNPELDPLLYRYLETCTYGPFSFYEVLRCETGRSLNCRDVIVGTEYEVFEESVGRSLIEVGNIIYAHLVEIDGITLLEAAGPFPFQADVKPLILRSRDLILDGAPVPAGIDRGRLFLEDRELELRKVFWNLVYRLVPPLPLEEVLGSDVEPPRLH